MQGVNRYSSPPAWTWAAVFGEFHIPNDQINSMHPLMVLRKIAALERKHWDVLLRVKRWKVLLLWGGVAVLLLVISKKILCIQWVIWRFWFLSEEVWEMIYLTCIKSFSGLLSWTEKARGGAEKKKNCENSAPLLCTAQWSSN